MGVISYLLDTLGDYLSEALLKLDELTFKKIIIETTDSVANCRVN